MRVLRFLLVVVALGPSCSIVDSGPEGGLLGVWSVPDPLDDASFSDIGGADAEFVYLIRDRTLTAYERPDGTVAWRADIRQDCAAVVVAAGRVFCPSNSLYTHDSATGSRLWSLESDATYSLVSGTADDRRAFAGTLTSAVAADARTGEVLWRRGFDGPGWVRVRLRALTLSDGELLASMDAEYSDDGFFSSSVVVALDPETGAELWRFEDGGPETDKSIGTLTAWQGLVLFSDGRDEAVAFDRATRRVVWRYAAEPGFVGTRRAPAVADGVAYWATGDNRVYAADARTGAAVWSVEPEFGSYRNHEVCGPVVLADNGALSVVSRADGRVHSVRFDRERVGQVAVADGFAYVSTDRGVYALDCGSL